jgi:hypothetical protein
MTDRIIPEARTFAEGLTVGVTGPRAPPFQNARSMRTFHARFATFGSTGESVY